VKKLLGEKGNWGRDDVVRIMLAQPATSQLVTRKLYRWLISETEEPSDALIGPLAESFAREYDIGALVGTMLRSNLFFSESAYRRRVKSPVEFAVGIVRALQGLVPTEKLGSDLAGLGQNLCHPPTVRGWLGGRRWISAPAMLGRANLATALLAGTKPYGDKLAPWEVAQRHGHGTPEAAARFLVDLFLQSDMEGGAGDELLSGVGRAGDTGSRMRRISLAVVTLPEFQLA
jgi:uncharacterized protein (DUF1800 family)